MQAANVPAGIILRSFDVSYGLKKESEKFEKSERGGIT
jgi:hypothetical protein